MVLFLDYDGTLTPIVEKPELAVISEETRQILKDLSRRFIVSIVSGRVYEDVHRLVNVKGIIYAGNHGFRIEGENFKMVHPQASEFSSLIPQIKEFFMQRIGNIKGVLIEEKEFSLAIHYRLVEEKEIPFIERCVNEFLDVYKNVRLMHGKKVFEILPQVDWDKGKAIIWIMQNLGIDFKDYSVIYIGDDTTDEDAFRILRTRGTPILVSSLPKTSFADFRLNSVEEVKNLLRLILG